MGEKKEQILDKRPAIFFLIGFLAVIIVLAILTGCPSPNNGTNSYGPTGSAVASGGPCGDYGQACCTGNYCDYGECNSGVCQHCGYFGEICCWQRPEMSPCEYGSECIQGRCSVQDDYYNQCGFPGYPPCYDDYGAYCSSGVYDSWSGICIHCGFYEQPCCPNTNYPCDYGQCVNGICKRTQGTISANTNWDNSYNDGDRDAYDNSDDYGQPINTNTGNSDDEECGYAGQPCCVDLNRLNPMGALTAKPPCYTGYTCWDGVCIEGGDYESVAYERPRGIY